MSMHNKSRYKLVQRLRDHGFAELWRDPINGQLYTREQAYNVMKGRNNEQIPTIEDGFGSCWSRKCAMCGRMSMEVVRPGKVQCNFCG